MDVTFAPQPRHSRVTAASHPRHIRVISSSYPRHIRVGRRKEGQCMNVQFTVSRGEQVCDPISSSWFGRRLNYLTRGLRCGWVGVSPMLLRFVTTESRNYPLKGYRIHLWSHLASVDLVDLGVLLVVSPTTHDLFACCLFTSLTRILSGINKKRLSCLNSTNSHLEILLYLARE